jgi:hypothetical protein
MSRIHISRNGEEPVYSKSIKRALLREERLSYGARGLVAALCLSLQQLLELLTRL